ncbi:MAG: LacI family DNA-binding transcriptional regulator [Armatimonadota bacterium]
MAVTISDVAMAAGVGRATVCRALRGSADVRPETRERIKKIAAKMNYHPNHIARSLVMGRSNTVAVVSTPDVFSLLDTILGPIEVALRGEGYSLLFITASNRPEDERACLEQVMQNRVAGVIVYPSTHTPDISLYQELVDSGMKMVILDRYIDGLEVPQIVTDGYQTARLQTEHLLSLGHTRIAYLMVPTASYSGRERLAGFKDAMARAGVSVDPELLIETQFGQEPGAKAMRKLLKCKNRPTAVIARHDIVAVGAMEAVFEAGLSVPDDVSFIGDGDAWFCRVIRVPLTTIRQPLKQGANIAVKKLCDMLMGKTVKMGPDKLLTLKLVERSSTAQVR